MLWGSNLSDAAAVPPFEGAHPLSSAPVTTALAIGGGSGSFSATCGDGVFFDAHCPITGSCGSAGASCKRLKFECVSSTKVMKYRVKSSDDRYLLRVW